MSLIDYLLAFLIFWKHAFGASSVQWESRSIYQVVTDRFARTDGSTNALCDAAEGKYCGGTWKGLIDRLDYIQEMGFTAIWISPVTQQEHTLTKNLASYHGYWQQDLFSVNDRFGSPKDLKDLSKALHDRGMYLMIDIVVNNLAFAGNGTDVDYSAFNPFNNERYFHPFKLLSEDDPNNENAAQTDWLGDDVISLPDLRTEEDDVARMLQDWVTSLVANYSVDGLRIDSALNVNPSFFPDFSRAAGVFCIGEVFSANASYACQSQEVLPGILNFPIYFASTRAFNTTDADMSLLTDTMQSIQSDCRDVHSLGIFTENHDVSRFANYTASMALAQNIVAFNMLSDGIPIIYYGQEQHESGGFNPVNREALWLTNYNKDAPLYNLIASANAIRTHAFNNHRTNTTTASNPDPSTPDQRSNYASYVGHSFTASSDAETVSHTLVMRKGFPGNQILTLLTNVGENISADATPQLTLRANDTGLTANEPVIEILSCANQTADGDGNLKVRMDGGIPKVLYPADAMEGSGLCGFSKTDSTANGSTNPSKNSAGSLQDGRILSRFITIPRAAALLAGLALSVF